MTAAELIALRKGLGLTQAAMADAMGLSKRAYSAIEVEEAALRQLHALAAERVALALVASGQANPAAAPASVRSDAVRLYERLTGLSVIPTLTVP